MVLTMRLVAEAAVAVAVGDEHGAAALVQADAAAMIGTPDGWYWRDRGATALVHVLVPQTRPAWEVEPLGAPHRIGLGLARALEGAREGDLTAVAALRLARAGRRPGQPASVLGRRARRRRRAPRRTPPPMRS